MKVSDEIISFGELKHVAEGRHLLSAVENLRADLLFTKPTAYAGEIWPFCAAAMTDGVTLRTTIFGEGVRAANARII